jgi:hypothetical protein
LSRRPAVTQVAAAGSRDPKKNGASRLREQLSHRRSWSYSSA